MVVSIIGELEWSMTRDSEGHRDYTLQWLLESGYNDGPANVMLCPGLPAIGSTWAPGDDLDLWAWCRPDMTVRPVMSKEPNNLWIVEQLFSTKPLKRCQDTPIEDPLSEPPDLSGTFIKQMERRLVDRNGDPIVSSSWEQYPDPVEVPIALPTVVVTRNVANLTLAVSSQVLQQAPLNDAPLWGVGARCVRLSNFTWQRKLYGSCSFYFTETLEFEIDYRGFDHPRYDWGTRKKKAGVTTPSSLADFENIEVESIQVGSYLDGSGTPTQTPVSTTYEVEDQANLLLLGIPSTLSA